MLGRMPDPSKPPTAEQSTSLIITLTRELKKHNDGDDGLDSLLADEHSEPLRMSSHPSDKRRIAIERELMDRRAAE